MPLRINIRAWLILWLQGRRRTRLKRSVYPLPSPPTLLVGAANGEGGIGISWEQSTTFALITVYCIERKAAAAPDSAFGEIDEVDRSQDGYTDGDVEAGQSYTYRVRAYGPNGYSDYTNSVTVSV